MRYTLFLFLAGCSWSGHAPETDALREQARNNPAWTPSPTESGFPEIEKLPDLSEKMSFHALVELALHRNSKLRAAVKRFEAAIEQVPQNASAPDPYLELEGSIRDFFRHLVRTLVGIGQTLLSPGKLEEKARIALEIARETGENLNAKILDTRLRIASAYGTLFALIQALRITQENQVLLDELEKAARVRYEANQVPEQDILKVHLQKEELRLRLAHLTRKRKETEAILGELINAPPETVLGTVFLPEKAGEIPDLTELIREALEQRPETAAVTHRLRQSEAGTELAKMEYWPDISGRVRSSFQPNGPDTWLPYIRIPLPFLRTAKRTSAMAQARALLGESWHLYQATRAKIIRELIQAHARVEEHALSLVLLQKKMKPLAKQNYEAALSGYRAGELNFLTAIDALIAWQKIEEEYFQRVACYFIATEELRKAAGDLKNE
jgi:cobalt-zinc-cadmium efflux system outer membrane protein